MGIETLEDTLRRYVDTADRDEPCEECGDYVADLYAYEGRYICDQCLSRIEMTCLECGDPATVRHRKARLPALLCAECAWDSGVRVELTGRVRR